MECIFYSYFENIKSNYSMKVKKDGGFYNINFIENQLEISDMNNILQDHLIKFNLQNEDETPKIQIISDVNTVIIAKVREVRENSTSIPYNALF